MPWLIVAVKLLISAFFVAVHTSCIIQQKHTSDFLQGNSPFLTFYEKVSEKWTNYRHSWLSLCVQRLVFCMKCIVVVGHLLRSRSISEFLSLSILMYTSRCLFISSLRLSAAFVSASFTCSSSSWTLGVKIITHSELLTFERVTLTCCRSHKTHKAFEVYLCTRCVLSCLSLDLMSLLAKLSLSNSVTFFSR